jgi:3-(3-hydroxy-phenyl)propionate hydroxylase
MVYVDSSQSIAPETVVALAAMARESVPVRAVVALAEPGAAIAGIDAIHDDRSLVRKRYDLKPESAYLFRPDQHVVARWRSFSADAVRAAVRRSLGHASR